MLTINDGRILITRNVICRYKVRSIRLIKDYSTGESRYRNVAIICTKLNKQIKKKFCKDCKLKELLIKTEK